MKLLIIFEEIDTTTAPAISFAVSVVCLIAQLAAFFITQETKYLHGKCIACQSVCLIAAFTGFFVNYLTLLHHNTPQCLIIGDINYINIIKAQQKITPFKLFNILGKHNEQYF